MQLLTSDRKIRPCRGQPVRQPGGHNAVKKSPSQTYLSDGVYGLFLQGETVVSRLPCWKAQVPFPGRNSIRLSAEKVTQATLGPPLCHWHQGKKQQQDDSVIDGSVKLPQVTKLLCVCVSHCGRAFVWVRFCRSQTAAVTWPAVCSPWGLAAGRDRGGVVQIMYLCVFLTLCVMLISSFKRKQTTMWYDYDAPTTTWMYLDNFI